MLHWIQLGKLALKQLTRHQVRTVLTVAGVATGMFLFTSVETLQSSLARATQENSDDSTLVVYRENRYCPSTSRLPEHYLPEILRIDGVTSAIPVQVTVNNCGASLDVITFRGVPPADLQGYNPDLEVLEGSFEAWKARGDAALLGRNFAVRRGLQAGDSFEAAGVRVTVAGVVRSPLPQDENVAYVHLPFLQQASRSGLGTVTQFNVRIASSASLEAVAEAIDRLFASDVAPTITRPEKAFFAQTARDLIEMVQFTRWLGLGAVLAVLGLVGNALLLAARGRVKEGAVLQTLGFSRVQVGSILVWEGFFLGLLGGLAGCLPAALFLHLQRFTLGNEGLTLSLAPSFSILFAGLALALLLGLIASLWPAFQTATRPVVASLKHH